MAGETMYTLTSKSFDELKLGTREVLYRKVSAEDVALFSEVSGDYNPIHLDPEYARDTLFGEPIAHGMLNGAIISAALSSCLPGPGSVYLGQSLRFIRPVKIDDRLRIELEVVEKQGRNKVKIKTQVFNQDDIKLVEGEAESFVSGERASVKVKSFPFSYQPLN